MWRKENLPTWFVHYDIGPILLTGFLLFSASYAMSLLLDRLGMQPASTILDDLAIAILGMGLLRYYLSASHAREDLARAKERMILVAELNRHIHNALTPIGLSATRDDQAERLRLIDESMARIDRVLMDLVPTVGSAEKPRFFLTEQ